VGDDYIGLVQQPPQKRAQIPIAVLVLLVAREVGEEFGLCTFTEPPIRNGNDIGVSENVNCILLKEAPVRRYNGAGFYIY
jgi:hypothetical protein